MIKKISQKDVEKDKERLVSRGYLKIYVDDAFKKFSQEERTMLHEALMESLENSKIYYKTETERYMKALIEEWRDESRAFHDYMRGIKDVQDEHGLRIVRLEQVAA